MKNILFHIEDLCDVKFEYAADIKKQLYKATEQLFLLFGREDSSYLKHVMSWYKRDRKSVV